MSGQNLSGISSAARSSNLATSSLSMTVRASRILALATQSAISLKDLGSIVTVSISPHPTRPPDYSPHWPSHPFPSSQSPHPPPQPVDESSSPSHPCGESA